MNQAARYIFRAFQARLYQTAAGTISDRKRQTSSHSALRRVELQLNIKPRLGQGRVSRRQPDSSAFVMKNKANEIQQQLGRQNLCAFCWIIGWCNLNQVNAHNLAALGKSLQQLQNFIILKPAMAGGTGARRNGWVERVNINGHIITGSVFLGVKILSGQPAGKCQTAGCGFVYPGYSADHK